MYTIDFETKEQLRAVLYKLHIMGYGWSNGDSLIKPSVRNEGSLSDYLQVGPPNSNSVVWTSCKSAWGHRHAFDIVGEGEPQAVITRINIRDVNIGLPHGCDIGDVKCAIASLLGIDLSRITITYDEPI